MRIGSYGVLQRNATKDGTLLRGFTGRRNYWTFMFENSRSLWALEDVGSYTKGSAMAAQKFQVDMATIADLNNAGGWDYSFVHSNDPTFTRPVLYRNSLGVGIVNWAWSNEKVAWVENAAGKVYIGEACYSITGRQEGGVWTVYTASRKRVFRVTPSTQTVDVYSTAPSGLLYRGVALPPYPPVAAPATGPTGPAASDTPTPTRTRSHSAKPKL